MVVIATRKHLFLYYLWICFKNIDSTWPHLRHFVFSSFNYIAASNNSLERWPFDEFLVNFIFDCLMWYSMNVKICCIWVNSNKFKTTFFFYHHLSTLSIFKIYVCVTILINFYCKYVFKKVKIKSFILYTVLSMYDFSLNCNLQCSYKILFLEIIFVMV